MGRAPCCDKANVKKGPWSPEEDSKLKSYIEQHGTGGNWIALPQKIGLKRCGKSCRLRWLNYLRPNLKHGGFSEEEDNIICSLYVTIGSRWSVIAAQLPGRTDNDIKNYWNTKLKKKLLGKHRTNKDHHQARSRKQAIANNNGGSGDYSSSSSSTTATHHQQQQPYYWSHMHMPVLPLPPPPPPLPPLPYAKENNQGPSFNDQDSLRKLLIKLGGKFSNNNNSSSDHDYQPPLEDGVIMNFDHQFPPYYEEEQIHHHHHHHHHIAGSSSSCMNNNSASNNSSSVAEQFSQNDNNNNNFNAAATRVGEMVSANNYPERLDGLEFFYGEEIMGVTTTDEKILETGATSNYPPLLDEDFSCHVQQ
ncbi:hypothetical protein PIB30_053599 [Stylosanthes scabra]|uniref:Uncharacterized protein n=1 Tax=Stylosanthes scabra TaxID=79078 RepID=A0ABU6YHD9_9FABA|nr:hypothetical protein [Stylosanthes scabra]